MLENIFLFYRSYLFKHSKQHFAAEITKCWGFVGVHGKCMRPNFYIFVPKRLHIDHNLYGSIFLNISYCIYHLKWRQSYNYKTLHKTITQKY